MLARPTISRCSTRTVACVEALESRRFFAASPLTPSILSDTLPSSVIAGASSKAVVKVKVVNSAGAASSGHGNIALFADTGSTLDSSATLLARANESFAIHSGKSKPFSIRIKSIPNLADGVYHVFAELTDAQGNVSSVLLTQTLTVAAPFVSISAAFQPLTSTSPSAPATIVLTNNGNETANLLADSYDENFATDPSGLNTVGTTVAGFFLGIARSLKADASLKLRLSYKEITARPGMYYLAFQLVGAGGTTLLTTASATQVTEG